VLHATILQAYPRLRKLVDRPDQRTARCTVPPTKTDKGFAHREFTSFRVGLSPTVGTCNVIRFDEPLFAMLRSPCSHACIMASLTLHDLRLQRAGEEWRQLQ
jgi:hypothetical protein